MKTGKGPIALSDEARDRVSEQLHARYVATIVGRLCEVGTLDLAAADLPIRVVDRPIDDFRTDPSLDLARYVRDVLVDRAAYLDERSFRLDFTESDFNLDDYVLHGDAAEDDRPIVRLAGREGSMTVRSDDFRRNAADLLPPAPKKDYLTSSGNRIREWKEKYSMEKNAYERGLAAYREHRNELRQKLKPLQAESALLEKEIDRAHVESKVYERYKTLPWYKRLKQRLTGKVPSKSTHHEKALLRMRELERLKEELQVQIDGLKAPCPPSEHRFPLVFGSRIAAWFKRQNRNEKPQISAPVRKLCEFVHAPSEKTFTAWLSLRKPNWHWQVFEQVFAEIFEKLPMEAFCRIPQTPSQYHVFRREENELLKMLEPVYHKNVVQEYRRERIELEKRETMRRWEQHEKLERMERMKREENLRREREDRLKWEADALAEERRRNPISDAQRHVLEDLHKEERLERMPSELSMREASALMANIFADDPLNPMQKANLLKHIRNGNLPDMPDSAINALTQKDYMPLIRQAWQKRDRDYVPEKARAQGKTRGMEL